MLRFVRVVFLGGIALAAGTGVIGAQRGGSGTNEPITPPNIGAPGVLPPVDSPGGFGDGGIRARMAQQRRKAMNDSRHQRLQDDVEKLISLTNELKSDVDKTNEDELSVDGVKKAVEIEKLAHDVQNRMRN